MVRDADGRRGRRVGESIRAELSRALLRQIGDPRLLRATITDVDMSPDLRSARVFYVPPGDVDREGVRAALDKAASFLRKEIGRSLALRFTPALSFHLDESFDVGSRVDSILRETRRDLDDAAKIESPEKALGRIVATSSGILLAVHANPDGDAIGSLLGMHGILRLLGKRPVAYCPDGVPATLRFLPGAEDVVAALEPDSAYELTILMDTADLALAPAGFPPAERRGVLAIIDHHAAHGDLGDIVVRRDVSAVGELLFDLAMELLWPLDERVAQCLYTSVVADTGSFRYTSTTPATHRVAAALIERGADPWAAATGLFESFSLARQRLLGLVAGTLEVSADGRCADLVCTPDMLAAAGAVKADLDGMINLGRSIEGVEISAVFRLEPEGHIKVSFRSKGRVDVAALASRFGGGGHRNASGATLRGVSIADAKSIVRKAAEELLAEPAELAPDPAR
ncbi:MAG: 30S ribosome-binding factor RbfA [Proteobacteria bacterium]|jgi:phosphoesterase RecJ-like protein|nr:30S ribosome-binding factor RbfA [Pseudomonadota bacterium]